MYLKFRLNLLACYFTSAYRLYYGYCHRQYERSRGSLCMHFAGVMLLDDANASTDIRDTPNMGTVWTGCRYYHEMTADSVRAVLFYGSRTVI